MRFTQFMTLTPENRWMHVRSFISTWLHPVDYAQHMAADAAYGCYYPGNGLTQALQHADYAVCYDHYKWVYLVFGPRWGDHLIHVLPHPQLPSEMYVVTADTTHTIVDERTEPEDASEYLWSNDVTW